MSIVYTININFASSSVLPSFNHLCFNLLFVSFFSYVNKGLGSDTASIESSHSYFELHALYLFLDINAFMSPFFIEVQHQSIIPNREALKLEGILQTLLYCVQHHGIPSAYQHSSTSVPCQPFYSRPTVRSQTCDCIVFLRRWSSIPRPEGLSPETTPR